MKIVDDKKFREEWVLKEKNRLEKGKGKYLHFDSRISNINKIAIKIWNPDEVVRRFFYPNITDKHIVRRYKNIKGKKIIEEKERLISISSHVDALFFSWYAYILSYSYEDVVKKIGISQHPIAYRSINKKSTVHFAKDIFSEIKNRGNCVALNYDIKGFFDNIDHKILKSIRVELLININLSVEKSLPKDHYAIYKAVTKFGSVNKKNLYTVLGINKNNIKKLHKICSMDDFKKIVRKVGLIKHNKTNKGIPQGNPISAILSNAYMISFDNKISKIIKSYGGFYYRYSDDIIVICDKKNLDIINTYILKAINDIKLEISEKKTEITTITTNNNGKLSFTNNEGKSRSLQYLGLEINDNGESIRGKSLARFNRKTTKSIKREKVIARLNKRTPSKRKIYKKYIHTNKQTFLTYANKAAKILDSKTLQKQINKNRAIKFIRKKFNNK